MIIVREDGMMGIDFDSFEEAVTEISTLTAKLVKFTVEEYMLENDADVPQMCNDLLADVISMLQRARF